jgi:hypothetical protein
MIASPYSTPPAYYRGDGVNLLDAFQGKAVARTRPIFWQWLGRSFRKHNHFRGTLTIASE